MQLDKAELQILGNAEEIARVAADEFVRYALEVVGMRGLLTVALSGGSTLSNFTRFLLVGPIHS